MTDAKFMKLSTTTVLNFVSQPGDALPKANMDITNTLTDSNLAYKIKTTAPNFFVVRPIQGILPPGRTVTIDIQLQSKDAKNLSEIAKNKFMVQGTPCDLQ